MNLPQITLLDAVKWFWETDAYTVNLVNVKEYPLQLAIVVLLSVIFLDIDLYRLLRRVIVYKE